MSRAIDFLFRRSWLCLLVGVPLTGYAIYLFADAANAANLSGRYMAYRWAAVCGLFGLSLIAGAILKWLGVDLGGETSSTSADGDAEPGAAADRGGV